MSGTGFGVMDTGGLLGRSTVAQFSAPDGQRRHRKLRDQWGRPWECQISVKSAHPVGPIQPMFTVHDPRTMPPQAYLRYVEQEGTIPRLVVEADRWRDDLLREKRAFIESVLRECNAAGIAWTPEERVIPAQVRVKLGDWPTPPELAEAVRVGNKWALGEPGYLPPEGLRALLGQTVAPVLTLAVTEFEDVPATGAANGAYDDLDELHDPDALGGETVPVVRGRRRRAREG